jgi:hypothetical protein
VELLRYLEAHDFVVYIASGGDLLYKATMEFFDDGPEKLSA